MAVVTRDALIVLYLIVGVTVGLSLAHKDTGAPPPIWLFVFSVFLWPAALLGALLSELRDR